MKLMRQGGVLLLAALAGGGVALGVTLALNDDEGGTTTVIREIRPSASPAPATFADPREAGTIQEVYRAVSPGVVQVISTVVFADDLLFGPQQASSEGSGFVIDTGGHIVTNYHVVQGAEEVEVNFSANDRMKAKVVGVDPSTDLAVLQIEAQLTALTPLPLGDSDLVQVGDSVVAIGNPFGLERTITAGIVSALQRQIQAPNGFTIDKVIQTDAPINPGNSGGPLLNARGEVIGVNAQIQTGGGLARGIGIGFAVPINTVRDVVSQIIEHGKVEHSYLGIQMQTIDQTLAETVSLPVDEGVLIADVLPGSPADEVGLRGGDTRVVIDGVSYILGGDVITGIDGVSVQNVEQVRAAVRSKQPGDRLSLEIRRDRETVNVTIELGRQPSDAAG